MKQLLSSTIRNLILSIVAAVVLTSCQAKLATDSTLEPVAFSEKQWTGVAVSQDDRLFVNFPRWSDNVPVSVAEIVDGIPIPYPNISMNNWRPDKDPATHLICVQSVFVDDKNRLWILDPASPKFQGVIPGGPKLLQVDLATNTVVRTFLFDADIATKNSYFNDVRIDSKSEFAYISDSQDSALVVLNLKTGKARRVLDNHPSTASKDVLLNIGGMPWLLGEVRPSVDADGIAYDRLGDMVYYQALTGRTMYRIPASVLREDLSEKEIEAQVEVVGKTGAADGLIMGPDGKIYISALEDNAIKRATPTGEVETVIQDQAISWPDSFSFGPDGKLYFTTSRIHEGATPQDKYGIYRLALP